MFLAVGDPADDHVPAREAVLRAIEKTLDAERDLGAEVDAAAADRVAEVGEARPGIGAAVEQDDIATPALYERVEPGVVEVAAVGQIAVRRQVGGLRQRFTQEVEGPERRAGLAPARGEGGRGPETEAGVDERQQHDQRHARRS